jgi:predicted phosphodiesterase
MLLTNELAREAVQKYPDTPSLTLAKSLYKNNPEVYRNLEAARSCVRNVRGANGRRSRKHATQPREFSKELFNPFKLPEAEPLPYPFVNLKGERFLVLSDIHMPYHDTRALTLALQKGKQFRADHVLVNGDLLDFYQLSRFDKDPRRRSFSDELLAGEEFFKVLRREFKDSQITWKLGNHEERYDVYMRTKAPELLDVRGMEIENLMGIGKLNVRVVRDKLRIKLGKLTVIHGHEYPTPVIGPVNAARGLFLRAKTSALCGHHHQVSDHSETDLNGKLVKTWSTGCLCQLNPHYARLNKWSHGFALVEVDNRGHFQVQNKTVFDGEVL